MSYKEIQAASQAVLNAAWDHILEQGEPSMSDNGSDSCMYKNPKGLGCAFAPAIKDYRPTMEGSVAEDLLDSFSDYLHGWAQDCDTCFANAVQLCHDTPAQSIDAGFLGPDKFIAEFRARVTELVYDPFHQWLELKHPDSQEE